MTVGIVPSSGGMNLLDSQTFTSSTTYTVPAGAKSLIVEGIGAGGGGGAGGRFNSNSYQTASGGSGGPWERTFLDVSEIGGAGSSVTVTIAAGGTGGTGVSTIPTNGGNGSAAGLSRFGPVYFLGGRGGQGANNTGQNESAGYAPFQLEGTDVKAFGKGRVGNPGAKGFRGGGGGGSGGWYDGTTAFAGTAGGSSVANPDMNTGPVYAWIIPDGGGGAAGAVATNGTAGTSGAGGGGGGARSTAGTSGNGGNGGSPGGGGGGGGVLWSAAGTSGAGGTGGDAQIKIWVYG